MKATQIMDKNVTPVFLYKIIFHLYDVLWKNVLAVGFIVNTESESKIRV